LLSVNNVVAMAAFPAHFSKPDEGFARAAQALDERRHV
jgi:hypothetical protein